MYIFQKTVEWQSKTFCFLAFKIFESDKEGSVSIKLQRIMVRRSDLCEQITNFSSHLYRKSLSNIEFYSDRISKASTPAVNIWIFRVERGGRWEVVRTRASQINLPPPELQQFYSYEPQHLGYHLGQHHLDYDITLSTLNTTMISLPKLLSLLICHWLILKNASRTSIDMGSFKCIPQQYRPWPS